MGFQYMNLVYMEYLKSKLVKSLTEIPGEIEIKEVLLEYCSFTLGCMKN